MNPPRFKDSVVAPTATLREAMVSLQTSALEICLVVDEGRLVGTVTDGDIRRALLAGGALGSRVDASMARKFTTVTPTAGRAEVLELMNALRISQVPIVDAAGKLEGLHTLHDILGTSARPNWAVIMAGGKGTRLAPLTKFVPKPMIRVAGRPILERIILNLVGFGIRRVFLAINYLGHMVEEHFGDGARLGCRIDYLREERPLGTGGALALLPDPIEHPVLVMNGDLVTQANVGTLLDFHVEGKQAATVATRRYLHTVPFGCMDMEGDRVLRIEEKPTLSRAINAGIYVLDPAVIRRIPRDEETGIPTVLEECLGRGDVVRGFEVDEDWIDVGQHEQLRRARGEI
jgi:dTDP-glucose pyrophosphorylase